MMDHHEDGTEFDVVLAPDGTFRVPDSVLRRMGPRGTKRYRLRLVEAKIPEQLRKKGVSQDEVDLIATLQLEPRGQAQKFLLSEGALKKHKAFRARIDSYRKGRGK
jgi:hypothetical protein